MGIPNLWATGKFAQQIVSGQAPSGHSIGPTNEPFHPAHTIRQKKKAQIIILIQTNR